MDPFMSNNLRSVPVLNLEVTKYHTLRKRLMAAYPGIEGNELADTLEGITDLHEMIAEIIRSALVDQALALGLKARIDEMRKRLSRLEARASKKRALVLDAMVEVRLKTLTQPDFTVSVRSGTPSTIVVSEDSIPDEFWIPQAPKLDRQALALALKQGKEVPGAALSNPSPTLSVRTR